MLEWTGERFVPWADAPAVAYEHLHRYYWLAQFVGGRRVLDLASGEGYGSNLLAQHAASVVGIDNDAEAVRNAAGKYARANLSFVRASIAKVPISSTSVFDIIACFEAIEHIDQHDEFLAEAGRLLSQEGLFVVSTPNKDVYSRARGEQNPFHVKELSFAELDALLTRYFPHVEYLGQRVLHASSLWPLPGGGPAGRELVIRKSGAEFTCIPAAERSAEYFVAVASRQPIPQLSSSILIDDSNELGRVYADAIAWKDEKLREMAEQVSWLQKEQLKISVLERERRTLQEHLAHANEQLEETLREFEKIRQSRGWKMILRTRRLLNYFRWRTP
jgi:cyclopropane fatty-acyl-phospholipid synthase-like methyltransferase